MVVSSMAFLLLVSVIASAAAFPLEAGLRRVGAPTRFAWLGAMALGPVLLGVRAAGLFGILGRDGPPAWVPVVELSALQIGPAATTSSGLGPEDAAAFLWLLTGLGLLALVARTHHLLLEERSGWESARVMERDVYVSTDRGPAVAGVRRPWIVLPRWVLSLPQRELRLVLLHEQEHLRARDTHLLATALALVALSAWNPITWWQLRRLRAAMELDCDRRVLCAAPDAAAYGASLLSVAARASGPSLGLAAFTERSLNLKRRILAMTAKTSRWTALGGGVLVVLGTVVGIQACGVDAPLGPTPTANRAFTVAPSLVNGEEVARALEREYPPLLRDAGVGGTVQVWVFIDTVGVVTDVRVDQTSGRPELDRAALRAAATMRFTPALDGEEKTTAWVAFPFTFRVKEPQEAKVEEGPIFTPFTQAPALVNRDEVARALEGEYPPMLRDAGVGGAVRVWIFIETDGAVLDARIDRSSAQPALDEAALRVARTMRFSPALDGDEKVPVWVSVPITFTVR